ncbi:MAG: hypothetical protein E7507_01860 [Ruminococcus sp.]|nr:hypothetical protein [Ruminococcus sp.]
MFIRKIKKEGVKMKKRSIISLITSAVMTVATMSVFTAGVSAASNDMFEYEIQDGKCVVTEYIGSSTGEITVGRCGNSYPAKIGDEAFAESKVTSVVLPRYVRAIGNSAFRDCKSLESITIYCDSIEFYGGEKVFQGCTFLTTIRGYTGSNAESYANRYGYEFEAIDEENEEGEHLSIFEEGKKITVYGVSDANDLYAKEITPCDSTGDGCPIYKALKEKASDEILFARSLSTKRAVSGSFTYKIELDTDFGEYDDEEVYMITWREGGSVKITKTIVIDGYASCKTTNIGNCVIVKSNAKTEKIVTADYTDVAPTTTTTVATTVPAVTENLSDLAAGEGVILSETAL